MKPPDPKRNGDPRKEVAAHMNPSRVKPDALADLSKWLKSQWLRHDVLFRALRNEQDKRAALRFARFVDAIKEVRK